jgi:Clostripain family
MTFPSLKPMDPNDSHQAEGVVLAVFAPLGSDKVLSTFPDGSSQDLMQHPLVTGLLKVAECGVSVVALIDRVDEDSYLIEIPADQPQQVRTVSRWKQNMDSPHTLAGLLRHARRRYPLADMVLSMEGHGAGFLPDVDTTQLTIGHVTGDGQVQWRIGNTISEPLDSTAQPLGIIGAPILPIWCPTAPLNHPALSTWAIAAAMKWAQDDGAPKLAVVHFNNCFNMSAELLHTISPYADFATGYCNYNFFTAGEYYPNVFRRLKAQGTATREELAQWFADENRAILAAKGNHPTVGGVVQLSRMKEIAERIDDLADALLAALRGATAADRPAVVAKIEQATVAAKQYDTEAGFVLETPDELTDICSFAATLQLQDFSPHPVRSAAEALQKALDGIKRYGESDVPWVDANVQWDFSEPTLAMNIFLPDPLRKGIWDWRSPYYLDVNPDPNKPVVQPNIIDFVKITDWVDFIVEYHKDVPFIGLLPAAIPEFPVFNIKYQPPRDGGGDKPNDNCPTKPRKRW